MLRSSVANLVGEAGSQNDRYKTRLDPRAFRGEVLFEKLEELTPQNDRQRALQAQALDIAMKLGQTRWLMYAQKASSVPLPLLAMLVFWLTLLFLSFALFVRPNAMIITSLVISALAVCGAIFLILEMYQPYSGLIHVSDAPLRAALAQLAQ
jgi:hypothetical protein